MYNLNKICLIALILVQSLIKISAFSGHIHNFHSLIDSHSKTYHRHNTAVELLFITRQSWLHCQCRGVLAGRPSCSCNVHTSSQYQLEGTDCTPRHQTEPIRTNYTNKLLTTMTFSLKVNLLACLSTKTIKNVIIAIQLFNNDRNWIINQSVNHLLHQEAADRDYNKNIIRGSINNE